MSNTARASRVVSSEPACTCVANGHWLKEAGRSVTLITRKGHVAGEKQIPRFARDDVTLIRLPLAVTASFRRP